MPERVSIDNITQRFYADREPSFPDISDEEIAATLAEASDGVAETLREVMAPPLLDLYARVESLLNNPHFVERINELAYFHPVDRAPYTTHLPGMPRFRDADGEDPNSFLARHLPKAMQHTYEVAGVSALHLSHGYPQLESYAREAISRKDLLFSDESWELWQEAHTAQDRRNHCILGGIAVELARAVYEDTDFKNTEQQAISTIFTYRNPTYLSMTATDSYFRIGRLMMLPESTEESDSNERERWARASSVLASIIHQDPQLYKDIVQVLEDHHHHNTVKTRTLRAKDKPTDLPRSVVRGYEEAVTRALTSVTAELVRSDDETLLNWQQTMAEILTYKLSSNLTRKSPLGYAGPVSLQGVGLADPPSERIPNPRRTERFPGTHRRQISQIATASLHAASLYWKREFHYRELLKSDDTPVRTGELCPFVQPHSTMETLSPNVIEATQQMIFLIANSIDLNGQEVDYDWREGRPYSPRKHQILKISWNNQCNKRGDHIVGLGLLQHASY